MWPPTLWEVIINTFKSLQKDLMFFYELKQTIKKKIEKGGKKTCGDDSSCFIEELASTEAGGSFGRGPEALASHTAQPELLQPGAMLFPRHRHRPPAHCHQGETVSEALAQQVVTS